MPLWLVIDDATGQPVPPGTPIDSPTAPALPAGQKALIWAAGENIIYDPARKAFRDTPQHAIDFGPWPGSTHATLTITGCPKITSDAVIVVTPEYRNTVDHKADEHLVAPPRFEVGYINPGVGFTVHAFAPDRTHGLWAFKFKVL